jgi:hypothetical protein
VPPKTQRSGRPKVLISRTNEITKFHAALSTNLTTNQHLPALRSIQSQVNTTSRSSDYRFHHHHDRHSSHTRNDPAYLLQRAPGRHHVLKQDFRFSHGDDPGRRECGSPAALRLIILYIHTRRTARDGADNPSHSSYTRLFITIVHFVSHLRELASLSRAGPGRPNCSKLRKQRPRPHFIYLRPFNGRYLPLL